MKRRFSRIIKKAAAFALAAAMTVCVIGAAGLDAKAANASNAIAVGIDVSKHNGSINWGAVAQSGIKFAFIKAGSTNKGMDPYFQANMNGAVSAGLRVGVYIYSYASTPEQAQNEANTLLNWIAPYTVSYPVVYDIENVAQSGLSKDQITALCNTFCSTVAAAGYYPLVYSSQNWFTSKLTGVGYDKWVAQYNDHLDFNGAAFWQSSCHGSISGVPTAVDMDYQFKDYSQLIISDGLVDRDGGTRFYAGYHMQRGWVGWNDTRYHVDDAGFVQKSIWFQDESGIYYLQGDGSVARGQVNVDGSDFYFNESGQRVSGWVALEKGTYFYAADTGVMVKGWIEDEAGKHYMSTKDGHLLVSDVTIENKNYYFGDDGIMKTGLVQKADGNTYYYDENGIQIFNTQIVLGDKTYDISKKGIVTEVVAAEAAADTTQTDTAAAAADAAATAAGTSTATNP